MIKHLYHGDTRDNKGQQKRSKKAWFLSNSTLKLSFILTDDDDPYCTRGLSVTSLLTKQKQSTITQKSTEPREEG